MTRENLLDKSHEELIEYVKELNLPSYRGGQIRHNLYKGIDFLEMSDLPKELRGLLNKGARSGILRLIERYESKIDGTIKYLFDLGDGNIIESVLMKYRYGYSACISSQVGCKMACSFCASSKASFARNLSSGEMLSQIITIQKEEGIRVSNVVVMGIGEPLDNYDNLIRFLREASSKDGLNISYRKISVSTCGLVNEIYRLAKERLPITLSISLHSPFDGERTQMMPINKVHSIEELMTACREYVKMTSRRISFEYAMIAGVNDTIDHAKELIRLVDGILCHINLIPVNKIPEADYRRSERGQIESFERVLKKRGLSVTIRRELGPDIEAACGQLRRTKV